MARRNPGPIGQHESTLAGGPSSVYAYLSATPLGQHPTHSRGLSHTSTLALRQSGNKTAPAASKSGQQAVKVFQIPAPTKATAHKTMELQVLQKLVDEKKPFGPKKLWSLFLKNSKLPNYRDLKQGELQSCPIASILAALAFTPKGRQLIGKMIKQQTNPTRTVLKGSKIKGANGTIGTRYFSVKLRNKWVDVSDVFFTDDSSPGNPIYMYSPSRVLWPCLIEKATAAMLGGNEALDAGLDPMAVWEDITGIKPRRMDFYPASVNPVKRSVLVGQIRQAKTVPMIAALDTIYHGVAVIGMKDASSVQCWDRSNYTKGNDPVFTIKELYSTYKPTFIYSSL